MISHPGRSEYGEPIPREAKAIIYAFKTKNNPACAKINPMFAYQTITSTGQRYYLSGTSPRVFILSGTHGDEPDIVPLVEKAVAKYAHLLSGFLYIPVLSPSANHQKTRRNSHGVDLNRNFHDDTNLPEAREIMNLLQQFRFDLVLDFHEDVILKDFYFYDTRDLTGTDLLTTVRNQIKNLGVGLYNDIDDPNDPALGYQAIDGYIYNPLNKYAGGIDDWMKKTGIMKREIVPEIPGQIPLDQKEKIIDIIFTTLVLPFYQPSLK